MRKKCANCGDSFSCENDISCWCGDFPKLSQNEIDDKDCLCKTCLLIMYRKKILGVWDEFRIWRVSWFCLVNVLSNNNGKFSTKHVLKNKVYRFMCILKIQELHMWINLW